MRCDSSTSGYGTNDNDDEEEDTDRDYGTEGSTDRLRPEVHFRGMIRSGTEEEGVRDGQ